MHVCRFFQTRTHTRCRMWDKVHRYAGEADGEARLVAGRTDPEGVWQYGRLEFRDRGFFVGLSIRSFTIGLGRRGAQVACRQFGFASGAEAIISTTSALPGPAGVTDIVSSIVCNGTEETLGDCGVFRETADNFCFGGEDSCNVALVCSNPTGVPLSCPVSVHLSIPRLYRHRQQLHCPAQLCACLAQCGGYDTSCTALGVALMCSVATADSFYTGR